MLEAPFGATIVNADGRTVPVRLVWEQHVREDLGSIPSFADWARLITPQAWMLRRQRLDESGREQSDGAAAVVEVPSGSRCPAEGPVSTLI